MSEWSDLYREHGRLRADGPTVVKRLRHVLEGLGKRNPRIVDRFLFQQLQPSTNPETRVKTFRLTHSGSVEIALVNLSGADRALVHLARAALTILLSLDSASGHLRECTLMVEGEKQDGTHWTVAIHLPDDQVTVKNPDGDRQGHGACGHAALHCHVGPTLDDRPKVRVPLPSLEPARLLEWLVSQVVPTVAYEPATWPDVMKELEPGE
jgi:hypothetical protein